MEDTIIKIDQAGRVIIPAKVRRKFKTDKFELKVAETKVELIPVKPLESLFGAVPEIDTSKIRKEHREEVENEE